MRRWHSKFLPHGVEQASALDSRRNVCVFYAVYTLYAAYVRNVGIVTHAVDRRQLNGRRSSVLTGWDMTRELALLRPEKEGGYK